MATKKGLKANHPGFAAIDKARASGKKAAIDAADQAATYAHGARQTIGFVSDKALDRKLWKKFVDLAKKRGKTIPEAMDEAVRMWIK